MARARWGMGPQYPELARKFATFLKEEHGVKKLGAIGYCLGGHAALLLGESETPLVDCCGEAHSGDWQKPPSKDAEDLKVPALFVFSHVDRPLPDADRDEIVTVLKRRNGEAKTRDWFDYHIYAPGTIHGFAIRCDERDDVQRRERDLSLANTKAFFKKWLVGS
ncbi:hypothetical protein HDU93_005739 [Gonapodya sp. JEL0774]|nr:hypothetical protein HDU93_005739 [Gonapodya sp. JEL0774]